MKSSIQYNLRRCITDMTIYIVGAVALVFGVAFGMVLGIAYRKKVTEAKIGSAEEQARRIIGDAGLFRCLYRKFSKKTDRRSFYKKSSGKKM